MITADVLRKTVDKLEASAVEIESKSREMFKGAKLKAIPERLPNMPWIGPTYSWEEPNDSEWQELQRSVTRKYQKWYLVALNLVKEYAPESLPDFTSLYKSDNSFSSAYKGFFNALWMKTGESNGNANMVVNRYMDLFEKQRSILSSIPDIAEIKELDLRRIISADLVVSELEHADRIYREHKREPCERAACVLAGVALERHLKTWCEVCLIPLSTDKKPTLNILITALYNGGKGHIDLTQKNELDTMSSIRNTCAHPETVKRSMVGKLIEGVRMVVLTWPME